MRVKITWEGCPMGAISRSSTGVTDLNRRSAWNSASIFTAACYRETVAPTLRVCVLGGVTIHLDSAFS